MKMSVSVDGNSIGEPKIVDTPAGYEDGIAAFERLANEMLGGMKPRVAVGGIAGPFSQKRASLIASPNLRDWAGKPLVGDIAAMIGTQVHIENDSALCALGEASYGAGRGYGIVAYVTISTGVGGARIVNCEIDEKSIGFEPGHQIIDADMTLEHGAAATFQDLVSGRGVEARMGMEPKRIADPEFWNGLARYAAVGLNNVIVQWSPDVLVLGGSMITGDPAIPVDRIDEELSRLLTIVPVPPIKKAELGNFGGIWGALAYAKSQDL